MGRKGSGVELRGDSVRLSFVYLGRPCRETLRLGGASLSTTYCTVALMGGVNPAYIATQAGHSPKMLLEVYARWIPGADGGEGKRRLAAAMGQNSSQILPIWPSERVPEPNEKTRKPSADAGLRALNVGRRDWTRTK